MKLAYDALPTGGVLVWNTADIPRGTRAMSQTSPGITTAIETGFRYRGEIIWDKDVKSLPLPGHTEGPLSQTTPMRPARLLQGHGSRGIRRACRTRGDGVEPLHHLADSHRE